MEALTEPENSFRVAFAEADAIVFNNYFMECIFLVSRNIKRGMYIPDSSCSSERERLFLANCTEIFGNILRNLL